MLRLLPIPRPNVARRGLLLLLALAAAPPAATAATVSFGFTGPEIYPIDPGVALLRRADLDGDGLIDLVLANNRRAKIILLYNRTGRPDRRSEAADRGRLELNELPPDARFRVETIASEKTITALDVADWNGDGRPDLAYYGEPKELILQANEGEAGWGQPQRWSINDGQPTPNGLTHGDLNGDGRTDLVLLGDNQLHLLLQGEDRRLQEPRKLPFSGVVKSVQALDIDGNGRDDLLLVNWDQANPFRFRLQADTGQLGPEIHFNFPAIHSYWADDLDGDHRTEMVTIALKSGRAQIGNFVREPAPALHGTLREGQLAVLPLNRTGKSRRGLLWADLDGDHRHDLIVSEPESGQVTIHLQAADGRPGPGRAFPTLAGISDMAVADWDGDGRPELFLLSQDERQVGVTRFDGNGRLGFPEPLALTGRPLVMAVRPAAGDQPAEVAVVCDEKGRRHLVRLAAGREPCSQPLHEDFRANPAELAYHDVDQDGRADLVMLVPYERLKLLLQGEAGQLEEVDLSPPGGNAEQPWMSRVDVDGDGRPELLLAQRNFVRAVVLAAANQPGGDRWTFRVKDQINGSSSQSRITGVAALPVGDAGQPGLFLLDAGQKVLSLCERDATGVWQVARNLELPVTDFNGLTAVGLGSAEPNAVGMLGLNAVAWLPLAGDVWKLTELDGYETPIRDGRLNDVVSGDLNQDGRRDLVFLETAKNHVDLVVFAPDGRLVPANRWKVFEERTFRGNRNDFGEPREAVVADFTGDGRNDLALLVHDRVLLYPQD